MTEETSPESAPESPQSEKKRKQPALLVWAVPIGLVLVLAVIAFFMFRPVPLPPDVWDETTVPFDPACAENCEDLGGVIDSSHGSPAMEFSYNPNVDDAVAQYGDCMQSVFQCIANAELDPFAEQSAKAGVARTCVAQSICPPECKDRFANQAAGSPDAVMSAFESTFIANDAWCLPRERNR